MSTLTTGQKVLYVLCVLQALIWIIPFLPTLPLVVWAVMVQQRANHAAAVPNPYRIDFAAVTPEKEELS